jgi:hypothetical protein
MNRHRRAIVAALVLMAAPLLYAVLTFAGRPDSRLPWLEPAKAQTLCVLPAQRMLSDHMNHLKGLRDQVMREGERKRVGGDRAQGIASCKGCHAHRDAFCDRCHQRASVQPDCFGCHVY